MSFISYAQNLEDVMLWRALKHIKNGFYVDVGANDPQIDSVTKHFYLSGWCGINIEPLHRHISALIRERPKDLNLQIAIGRDQGSLDLWECDVRGWATGDREIAAKHEAAGYVGKWHTVAVTTLRSVFAEYLVKEIHFLKVDVEGLEHQVLLSNDWSLYRPWIVLVEATIPASNVEAHEIWEPTLTSSEYTFVYADGLNRFYLANEHMELQRYFTYPPNVFDDYKVIGWVLEEEKVISAESRASLAEKRAAFAEERVVQLLGSTSWRVTAPLRFMGRAFRMDYFKRNNEQENPSKNGR